MRALLRLALLLVALVPLPAQAAITITFWSHDFGERFPHAFFTLRGRADAGGPAIDANYGFTARAVTPAILWGSVAGRLDSEKRPYLEASEAQFSVVMSDAQYAAIVTLIRGWDARTGDAHYNLGNRNCVHFVAEAARRVGLSHVDQPALMKKPRAYLLAVEAANVGRVIAVNRSGAAYLAQVAVIDATPGADRRP